MNKIDEIHQRIDRRIVNEILSGSYNEEGIARWWSRPRVQLGGKTPAEVFETDSDRIIKLAEELEGPQDAT